VKRWRFLVTKDGWCGYNVECLLRTYGIAIADRGLVRQESGNLISFTVKLSQANFAEYTLCRAGLEIRCKYYNLNNSNAAPNYMDKHSSLMPGGGGGIRRDMMTRILDFVSPFMGTKTGKSHTQHGLPTETRKSAKVKKWKK
jgi:hypothetical protein